MKRRNDPKSLTEAVGWIKRAADSEFSPAKFELAQAYATGKGVSKNDEKALKWLQLAPDEGWPDAQYKLGMDYAFGRGVEKDINKVWTSSSRPRPAAAMLAHFLLEQYRGKDISKSHLDQVNRIGLPKRSVWYANRPGRTQQYSTFNVLARRPIMVACTVLRTFPRR